MFSHDPSSLFARMMVDDPATPPQPTFQLQDYESFPALQPNAAVFSPQLFQNGLDPATMEQIYGYGGAVAPAPGLTPPHHRTFIPGNSSRPHSRAGSRQPSRVGTPSIPAVDDNEAFPSLGSAAAAKAGKKHHGKRGGHGHGYKETPPSSFAELARNTPSPGPVQLRKGIRQQKGFAGSRENSAAAQAIPAPEHIPWLETGDSVNKAYMKSRQEAFKHGGLRNKFLQR